MELAQTEAGVGCPITMTFAAVPALRHEPGVAGQMHRLSGVVVYAPKAGQGAGKVFVPRDAAEIIRMHGGP